MAIAMKWHETGKKFYETGVSNGALYVKQPGGTYGTGVPWNGLINVTESPEGAESSPIYADNVKYLNLTSAEDFKATVEAYTYPDEFMVCDGSAEISKGITIGQQPRSEFGLAYKTLIGSDDKGTDAGYKLHIIYNAKAAPSEKAYASVNESPEAITFSWELTTTPVDVAGHKPTAIVTIDSRTTPEAAMTAIEDKLYGASPALPTPDEIVQLVAEFQA